MNHRKFYRGTHSFPEGKENLQKSDKIKLSLKVNSLVKLFLKCIKLYTICFCDNCLVEKNFQLRTMRPHF